MHIYIYVTNLSKPLGCESIYGSMCHQWHVVWCLMFWGHPISIQKHPELGIEAAMESQQHPVQFLRFHPIPVTWNQRISGWDPFVSFKALGIFWVHSDHSGLLGLLETRRRLRANLGANWPQFPMENDLQRPKTIEVNISNTGNP